MKVTICDCCGRKVDVHEEMIRNILIPKSRPNQTLEERQITVAIELCQDCYYAIGCLAEGGDLKKLIDKAKKRRRRR